MSVAVTGVWREAADRHAAALDAFVARAAAVGAAAWNAPAAEGKWTPAQVVEHVRMTYDIAVRELEGGGGLRVRTSWWLRPLLRLKYLRAILASGRVPRGARAPREARPGDGPFDQAATLAALGASSQRFLVLLEPVWHRNGPVLTHHIFGRLGARETLRFMAVHTSHHAQQLPEVR